MSKILLSVDTETKTVRLKVDGQEIPDVESFQLMFFDQYCSKHESFDCECDLPDTLSINFSVEREIEGKNTETRINYCLDNSEDVGESDASVATFKDVPGFIGAQKVSETLQQTIAKIFK